ncbi:MAG: hypothetical protein ABJN60_00290 [Parasphingorhabdus sp.]
MKTKNNNGSIEDNEIVSETIYAAELGAALAKAIHSNSFPKLPKFVEVLTGKLE